MRTLEPDKKTIKSILIKRARGWSLSSLARIFHLKSREMVKRVIYRSKKNPEFRKLHEEIERTQKFLQRKLEE